MARGHEHDLVPDGAFFAQGSLCIQIKKAAVVYEGLRFNRQAVTGTEKAVGIDRGTRVNSVARNSPKPGAEKARKSSTIHERVQQDVASHHLTVAPNAF